ncbi:MAG: MFS transporter [Candidatus Limnocylindria bacterium]
MFRSALRQVAGNPALIRLEGSWLAAWVAEGAYLVSLLVFAYDIGGVVAVGLITMLRSLPAGLLAPVLTALADRFPPSRVLLGVHLGRASLVGIVALVAATDLPASIAVVAAIAEGLLIGLHRATTLSFMPGLARSPEELLAGNAVVSLGEGTGILVGPLGAGLLLTLGGPQVGLAAAAGVYLLAAAVVVSIRAPATRRRTPVTVGPESRLLAALGGFAALRRHPSAGLVVGLFGSQTFVRGALTVLIVAVAVELLRIGDSGVGYLTSALGAGGLVGATLAMTVVTGRGLATPFAVSLAIWGLPILVIGLLPQTIVAFVLVGVVGAANASLDVSGFTLLQRCVPNEVRGRVFGALESVAAIGLAAGAAVVPALVAGIGLEAALIVVGAVLPVLAIVTYPMLRRADDAAIVPHRELDLLRRVPMFAPLPLTMIEHLARDLDPVAYPTGERVITQGDPGDCFYVIGRGSVEIVHDGEVVKVLGPGDGFGEIALLSDRPRTASVVVRDAIEGYRLDRPAFLEAVTGSPHAVTAGEALVSQRLAELGQGHDHAH